MLFLIWLMVLHFIADFLLQSREMGQKKSNEVKWLLKHLAIQFGVFFIGITPPILFSYIDRSASSLIAVQYPLHILVLAACMKAFMFSVYNALIHGLIDWNIWKLYKVSAYWRIRTIVAKKHGMWTQPPEDDVNIKAEIAGWKYWEDHWFYTTIGFDQLLHMSTLVALAFWLL